MKKLGIINCGISNLTSIYNAYMYLGADVSIVEVAKELADYSHIILPGVGAYSQGVARLKKREFFQQIHEEVKKGKPVMGICLGMQLFSTSGDEFGPSDGLNLIPGTVKKIPLISTEFKLPHVGWNNLHFKKQSNLFYNIEDGTSFYFVHSYAYQEVDETYVSGITDYENEVIAVVEKDHVFGVQFHPEKSQKAGLQLLQNFLELC